jgi:hypothetical protein
VESLWKVRGNVTSKLDANKNRLIYNNLQEWRIYFANKKQEAAQKAASFTHLQLDRQANT